MGGPCRLGLDPHLTAPRAWGGLGVAIACEQVSDSLTDTH